MAGRHCLSSVGPKWALTSKRHTRHGDVVALLETSCIPYRWGDIKRGACIFTFAHYIVHQIYVYIHIIIYICVCLHYVQTKDVQQAE